eukprot:Em0016g502a
MPVGEGVCLATWGRNPQVEHVYTCSSNLIGQDLSVCHPSGLQLIGLSIITACCQTNYCNTPDYLMSVVNELGPGSYLDFEPLGVLCLVTSARSKAHTSGRGSGHPFLVQRTVARNIRLGDPIGSGSYGKNITCYCNQPTEDCIRVNSGWGQCSMPAGEGVCLATWEKIPQLNVVAYTYTCSSNLIDLFVCQPSRPHHIGSSLNFITTCCLTNYCNTPDYLMSVVNVLDSNNTQLQSPTNVSGNHLHTDPLPRSDLLPSSFLPILITSCIIAIIVIVAILFYVVYKRLSKPPAPGDGTHTVLDMENMGGVPQSLDSIPSNTAHTSGSGSGHPFLVQRTVARNIRLGDPIGSGRYGQVLVGHHQGEMVAVKKFASRDELSWRRETEIYSTVLLRHENILVYIASDIVSNHDVTELWLITQYHSHGSLCDYLSSNQVDNGCTVQLLLSIWNGLTHLHTELFGIQSKPAIAHRDMKSRNILVKANLTCCIADFGLAVMKVREKNAINLPANHKQGTIRYMAPEILDDSINMKSFESFKHVDVYAAGLVMWEICRRTASSTGQCEEYELPFQGMVPPDPSLLDMRTTVVDEKKQPPIPPRWTTDKLLANVVALMQECWYPNPLARPTALYFKKKLLRLAAGDNN